MYMLVCIPLCMQCGAGAGHTYPRKAPALRLNIGGVAQLTTWPTTNGNLMNGKPNVIQECLSESIHEVCIALQCSAALQHTGLVCKQTDVLVVAGAGLSISRSVCTEEVCILFSTLQQTTPWVQVSNLY